MQESSMASSSEKAAVVENRNCCLENLILQNHSGNSTQVNLFGGQVTSWKDEQGEEFLFLICEALCCCQGSCASPLRYRPRLEDLPPLEEVEESHHEEQARPEEHAAPSPAAHAAGPWSCRLNLFQGIVVCWLCCVTSYLCTNCFKNLGAHNIWAIPLATGTPLIVYSPRLIKMKWGIDMRDEKWRTGMILYKVLISSITAAGSLILAPHLDGVPGLLATGFALALVILCGFIYWDDTGCGFTIIDMMTAIFLDRMFKEIHYNIPALFGISFLCYIIREAGMVFMKHIYQPKENGELREFLVHIKDSQRILQNALQERGVDPNSIPQLAEMRELALRFETKLPTVKKEEPV